ncbi:hypothetical protein K8I31_06210, partial [bacterium]|nr:hypothetical protein [bacterium]
PDVSGIELRSDVFVITAIPDPAESVFLSYNSGQSSNRITSGYNPETGEQYSAIELQVDANNNGSFGDVDDFVYAQENQGISWAREQFGEVDEWHFPEYRSYISEEHQGMTGRIYVAETMTGGWAWMAVDDFYFWNGAEGVLAFPNSDFEMGDMTNWNEDNTSTGFTSWLASNTPADQPVAPADQTAMNGIVTWTDGNWSADSAPTEVASGDDSTGVMFSEPFTIPTLVTSPVREWSLY